MPRYNKILLTGGTGFVGRYLMRELLVNGYQIRVLARNLSHPVLKHFANKIDIIEGDLLDVVALEKALEGIDAVIHAAAVVSFKNKDKNLLYKVNQIGTRNVVNLCVNHPNKAIKLVHISSVAALGRTVNDNVITETTAWKDSKYNSPYAKSKYFAELEVLRGVEEGLQAVIVNPSIIVGVGDFETGTSGIFKQIAQGIPFYPPGSNGFVSVEDVAKATVILLESNFVAGERFILNSENLSYERLFGLIAKSVGKKAPTLKIPSWLLLSFTWLFGWLTNNLFLGYQAALTASKHISYSAEQFENTFNYNFVPIEKVIFDTATAYKSGNKLIS